MATKNASAPDRTATHHGMARMKILGNKALAVLVSLSIAFTTPAQAFGFETAENGDPAVNNAMLSSELESELTGDEGGVGNADLKRLDGGELSGNGDIISGEDGGLIAGPESVLSKTKESDLPEEADLLKDGEEATSGKPDSTDGKLTLIPMADGMDSVPTYKITYHRETTALGEVKQQSLSGAWVDLARDGEKSSTSSWLGAPSSDSAASWSEDKEVQIETDPNNPPMVDLAGGEVMSKFKLIGMTPDVWVVEDRSGLKASPNPTAQWSYAGPGYTDLEIEDMDFYTAWNYNKSYTVSFLKYAGATGSQKRMYYADNLYWQDVPGVGSGTATLDPATAADSSDATVQAYLNSAALTWYTDGKAVAFDKENGNQYYQLVPRVGEEPQDVAEVELTPYYSIRFNYNDGTDGHFDDDLPLTTVGSLGVKLKTDAPSPTRSGYELVGWALSEGDATPAKAADPSVPGARLLESGGAEGILAVSDTAANVDESGARKDHIDLYAVWESTDPYPDFTVSFMYNGGKNSETDDDTSFVTTVKNDSGAGSVSLIPSSQMSRSGYVFAGWAAAGVNNGGEIDGSTSLAQLKKDTSVDITTDTIFYAQWDPLCTVTFVPNSASAAKATVFTGATRKGDTNEYVQRFGTYTGTPQAVTAQVGDGYDFLGWSEGSAMATAPTAQQAATAVPTYTPVAATDNGKTYYANFGIIATLDYNGGQVNGSASGESFVTLAPNKPNVTLHDSQTITNGTGDDAKVLVGWWKAEKDSADAAYSGSLLAPSILEDGQLLEPAQAQPARSTAYTAVWDDPVEITYQAGDNGSLDGGNKTITVGEKTGAGLVASGKPVAGVGQDGKNYKFDGWYVGDTDTTATGTTDSTDKTFKPARGTNGYETATYTAKFVLDDAANAKTLTLNYNGGHKTGDNAKTTDTVAVEIGDNVKAAAPTTAERDGYVFLGWSEIQANDHAGTLLNGTEMVQDDKTIYAVWDEEAVITFDTSNATYGSVSSVTPTATANGTAKVVRLAAHDSATTQVVATPSANTGYEFAGWTSGSKKSASGTPVTAGVDDTLTITKTDGAFQTATYYVNFAYRITLDYNDGNAVGDTSKKSDTTDLLDETSTQVALPTTGIVRGTDNFLGWSATQNPTASATLVANPYPLTSTSGPTTLYAVWDSQVTLTYQSANSTMGTIFAPTGKSTPSGTPLAETIGAVQGTPNGIVATAAAGYQFDCFTVGNSKADGGTVVAATSTSEGNGVVTAATLVPAKTNGAYATATYYANFKPVEYDITFHKNDGTSATETQTAEFGTPATLAKSFTRTGYELKGWERAAAEADAKAAAIVANGSTTATWAVADENYQVLTSGNDLYAVWVGKVYDITFDNNGGQGTMEKMTMRYGDAAKDLRANAFTRDGFRFGKWLGSDGKNYTDQQSVKDLNDGNDIVMKAQWIELATVTFDLNGATSPTTAPAAQTGDVGASITLPDTADYAKTGQVQNGWNTAPDGSGTHYDSGAPFTLVRNQTLYVQWSDGPTTYSIVRELQSADDLTSYIPESPVPASLSNIAALSGTTVTASVDASGNVIVDGTTLPDIPGFELSPNSDGASVKVKADGTSVLTLQYDRKSYTVTYKYAGADAKDIPSGVALPQAKQYRHGTQVTVELLPTAPTGYQRDAAGWQSTGANAVTISANQFQMPIGDVELTLTWQRTPLDVTFKQADDEEHGTVVTSTQQVQYLESPDMAQVAYTEGADYKLLGWAQYKADGTTLVNALADPATVQIQEATVFVAVFGPIPVVAWLPGDEGAFDGEKTGNCDSAKTAADYMLSDAGRESTVDTTTGTKLPKAKAGYRFAGWSYTDTDGTAKTTKADESDLASIDLSDNRIFTATWEPTDNTLTLDLSNGPWFYEKAPQAKTDYVYDASAHTAKATAKTGADVQLPKADEVTRPGYVLTGWTGALNYAGTPETKNYAPGETIAMPRADATLVPVFEADEATITFKPNNASWGSVLPTSVTIDAVSGAPKGAVTNASTATANFGHTLKKWVVEGSDVAVTADDMVIPHPGQDGVYHDTTYVAVFAPWQCDVMFELAAGDDDKIASPIQDARADADKKAPYGGTVGTAYGADKIVVTPASGWDHENAEPAWSYTVYPLVDNHDGTYSYDATGTTGQTDDPSSVEVSGKIVFTPNFVQSREAKIVYDSNNGEGTIPDLEAESGATVTLSDGMGLSRAGHTLDGWALSSDGDVEYGLGASIAMPWTAPDGVTTLFAHWTEDKATVTYISGGASERGEISLNNAEKVWGSMYSEDIPVLSGTPAGAVAQEKDGYEFLYWVSDHDFGMGLGSVEIEDGVVMQVAAAEANDIPMSTQSAALMTTQASSTWSIYSEDREIMPGKEGDQYVPATYMAVYAQSETPDPELAEGTITFDANGGKGTVAPITGTVGGTITTPSGDALTRDGYTFDGWNTSADGSGTSYAPGSAYPVAGDATLYAQWKKNADVEEPVKPDNGNKPNADNGGNGQDLKDPKTRPAKVSDGTPQTGDPLAAYAIAAAVLALVALGAAVGTRRNGRKEKGGLR